MCYILVCGGEGVESENIWTFYLFFKLNIVQKCFYSVSKYFIFEAYLDFQKMSAICAIK